MKRMMRSAISILLVVLAVLIVLRANKLMADPIFENSASSDSIDAVKRDDSFNALLVGLDKSGVLADAIMLVNVDRVNGQISMLSIPRDTRVLVGKKYKKINSCYANGIDELIDEVKQLTGVSINYYAVVEIGAIAAIVDSLGGVEYTVEKDMVYSDPSQDLYINLRAGTQILTGDMAEQYCRYRRYLMGDFERTQHQQKFFKALLEQKFNVKNITKLFDVYNSVKDKVKTNVSFADIASNIDIMKLIKSDDDIRCFDTPGEFNDMKKDGISYYIVEEKNLDSLRNICIDYFS